jgi:hypothetical protein
MSYDSILGGHDGVSFEFEYLGKFEFIFETDLGYEPVGWRTVLMQKIAYKMSCDTISLSVVDGRHPEEINYSNAGNTIISFIGGRHPIGNEIFCCWNTF